MAVVSAGLMFGCSGLPSGGLLPTGDALSVTPATPSVRAGAQEQFTASVPGSSAGPTITWMVNGTPGGNSTVGTITTTGNYTAPATIPNPNTVTISASVESTHASGSTTATLLNPVPEVASVSPSQLNVGPFTITLSGSDFVNGAVVSLSGTALTTTFVSATQLKAAGTTTTQMIGPVQIVVTNPDPGSASSSALTAQVVGPVLITPEVADRFLEQTTFGPTPPLITQVQETGLQGFLTQQFSLSATPYATPDASEMDLSLVQNRFFVHAITAQDQLRQRVAFALSQIFVISGNKITDPTAFTEYLKLLQNDAFTNYRQIMNDVTLSPAMGHFLDMVNNDKPKSSGDHANENYARELMQLFTIGTAQLNPDGSQQTDANGEAIATYSQDMVQAFAKAYTGWTYPTQPGQTAQKHNPAYWIGSMVADDANHDMTAKQLLQYPGAASGGMLPAGQTASGDLQGALDNIFNHPNVGPFVSRLLIQHLVTSNPSPAYVQRVAAAFDDNGSGVRGDMKAVLTAILLDPEARRGDDPASANPVDGHLQEPILYIAGLYRAFGATTDGSNLSSFAGQMGESPLNAASVFNFFSPDFQIPGTNLFGPEFQILTTSSSLTRANFVNTFVFGKITNTTVSFSSYASQASNPTQLLGGLSTLLLHGTMSSDMQNSIVAAMQAVPAGSSQSLQQAETAIYLVGTSSQYEVQH
ncbi:MAG TPA: DUF1800 family protein [Candidatus Limnocylindrales bacterium]|nr:DUF1800 family protein [Candidatus Limnocylindrales bacterium]